MRLTLINLIGKFKLQVTNVTKWFPGTFIDVTEQTENYAILLLNRPISFDKNYFKQIWNHGKKVFHSWNYKN